MPFVHRVERGDRGHFGLGQANLGTQRNTVRGDVTLLGLHEVQHRQQRRALLRVARHDRPGLDPGPLVNGIGCPF